MTRSILLAYSLLARVFALGTRSVDMVGKKIPQLALGGQHPDV